MFDVCVVGGGMVGAAIALGLSQKGYQVAIVEQHMPHAFTPEQPPDIRVSAISAASQSLLEQLGAWPHIAAMRLCPYRRLSVWEKPDCRTDFNAADIQAEQLGHIVENRLIQLGIHQALGESDKVTWFIDTTVEALALGESGSVTLGSGEQIKAKLIIAADGARSRMRQLANIGVEGWQYSQQALGIMIRCVGGQQDITWQEFHPSGPRAYLPLYDGYGSLVWYDSADKIRQLRQMDPVSLKQQIVAHFPPELDDFDVLQSASFPLTRQHANDYVKQNLVLIGDAAHTINPLAGQGVNLGFKDVKCLLERIDSLANLNDPQALGRALLKYQSGRRPDNLLMMSTMDLLYKVFSNTLPPVQLIRNLGLSLANRAGPLKNQVMRYAMGL